MAYIFCNFVFNLKLLATYSGAVNKRRRSSCKKHMNSEQALVHQSFKVLFLIKIISLDAAVISVSWVVKIRIMLVAGFLREALKKLFF